MKISGILLLSTMMISLPIASHAQTDRKERVPSRAVHQALPVQAESAVALPKGTHISDRELAKLNADSDRHLVIFSGAADIPVGQRNVDNARRRATRLTNRLLRSAKASRASLESIEVTTGVINIAYVEGLTPQQIRQVRADRRVADVEKEKYFRILRDGVDTNPASWGLDRIDQRNLPLDSEHNYSDKTTANIYVMDGGSDFTHPEFSGRTGDQIDFTGDSQPSCDNHGTHIAGTMAGSTYGIARNAKIHDLKVAHCTSQWASTSWFINPINHVANTSSGQAVINYSISIPANQVPGSMVNAVNNAVTQHNIVFVTSSGNITSQSPNPNVCAFFPNNQAPVLTVAYSTLTDQFGTQAKRGSCVDLAAPGQNIVSAKRFGANGPMSGTSMAAPHVAGIAASIWMDNPSLTAQQVMQKVVDDATPGALSGVPSGNPNLLAHYKPPVTTGNQPPHAVASINWSHVYSARPGVQVSAAASSDPDNNTPLTYTWTETNHGFTPPSMTPDMLNDAAIFTAPVNNTSSPKTYYFDLEVKDSLGLPSVGSSGVSMVVVPDACTPYDANKLLDELKIGVVGSANNDFTVTANLTKLETTLQAYVSAAQSQNPQVSGGIHWMSLRDRGTGPVPGGSINIPNVLNQSASLNGGTFAVGPSSSGFWSGTPLEIDHWYRLASNVRPIHNGGGMNNDCTNTGVTFRLPDAGNSNTLFMTQRSIEFYDDKTGTITTGTVPIYPAQVTGHILTGGLQMVEASSDVRLRHKSTNQCLYSNNGSGNLFRHWSCWADPAMVFEKIPASPGRYQLKHKNSGQCVKAAPTSGGEVTTATCSSATEFELVSAGGMDVRLKQAGQCVYATPQNGGKTHNWGCWADPNMSFVLDPT